MTNTAAAQVPTTDHPVRIPAGTFVIVFRAHYAGHYSVHIEHACTGFEIDHLRRTWATAGEAQQMVNNAYTFLTAALAA